MRPTHFGVKSLLFFTAITGAFYAAPYVNLFFLLLAFFGAHWVLGIWWTYANLRGIEATIGDPGPIQAGTRARVDWAVVGERRRFGLTLRVELESGAQGTGRLAFTGGDARAVLQLPALGRGVHRARAVMVSSTYPFGLLTRTVTLAASPVFHVYPEPTTATPGHLAQDSTAADAASGLLGSQGRTMPAGLRPRVEGEALREVHWRASARRGSLVINEWEADVAEEEAVVLDRRCAGEAFERRLSAVAGAVTEAKRRGSAVRVVSQGLDQTFTGSGVHFDEALRFLAEVEPLPESAAAPERYGAAAAEVRVA